MRKAVELVDSDVDRVDGVDGPATGIPFLLMKSNLAPTPRDVFAKADDMADDSLVTDPEEMMEDADDAAAGEATPTEAPGDPNEPGSPAWEAVDAARARLTQSGLIDLKQLVCEMADREAAEASAGEAGADDNAWDLAGVLDNLDCALACVSYFAATEQAEADQGAQQAEDDARALGLIKSLVTDPDGFVEALEVMKAGRVLSAANEAALRQAAEAIQNVLAALPAPVQEAPVAKADTIVKAVSEDAPGEPMETETPAVDDTAPTDGAVVTTKAKGDPLTPVYDENGKLVGMIDSTDLIPIATAKPAAADATDEAPAEDAPAAPPADLTPAAPGEVGTPADDTTPEAPVAPEDGVAKSMDPVIKSLVDEAVKAALAEKDEIVKTLEDRIATLEAPAARRVLRNGQIPPAHLLRGQNDGAPVDTTNGAALRKSLMNSTDATEQKAISDQMQSAAYEAILNMHKNGPRR